MTTRIRALLIFLTVMVVLLSAAVVEQLYMISNLDDRSNELETNMGTQFAEAAIADACLSARIDAVEAGDPIELEPGEVMNC